MNVCLCAEMQIEPLIRLYFDTLRVVFGSTRQMKEDSESFAVHVTLHRRRLSIRRQRCRTTFTFAKHTQGAFQIGLMSTFRFRIATASVHAQLNTSSHCLST
jgi:hypothetical protein